MSHSCLRCSDAAQRTKEPSTAAGWPLTALQARVGTYNALQLARARNSLSKIDTRALKANLEANRTLQKLSLQRDPYKSSYEKTPVKVRFGSENAKVGTGAADRSLAGAPPRQGDLSAIMKRHSDRSVRLTSRSS